MNWGPGAAGGFQNALQTGLMLGGRVRQNRERNALMEQRQQALALQEQQARARADQAEAQQRRADLPMLTNLLEHAAQGPEQWQQAVATAQQYGIDVSSLPQQFDPQWATQQAQTMRLLSSPQGQEALSTAGKQATDEGLRPGTPDFQARVTELVNAGLIATQSVQPGGTVVSYDKRTGVARPIIQGSSFGGSGQPTPTAINPETGERLEVRDGQWVPVGGASSNASGGF